MPSKPSKTQLFKDLFNAAACGKHLDIPKLIEHGADPLKTDKESLMSPLQIAAANGHLEAVIALLPHSDPNYQENLGISALMFAAQEEGPENSDIYFALLPHSNPHLLDSDGGNLLHYACASDNPNIIQSALSFCSPDSTDDHGDTPLHVAARTRSQHPKLTATALNVHLRNKAGLTPIDIYRANGSASTASELEQLAKSLAEKDTLQQTIPNKTADRRKTKL